jgi:rRNA processing protein Krr1/Pno1
MGEYKGLKEVRRIVLDCMKNVHPIYRIKVSLDLDLLLFFFVLLRCSSESLLSLWVTGVDDQAGTCQGSQVGRGELGPILAS